jgi:AraC-like DNA-binding protein
MVSFVHAREHWSESAPSDPNGRVALSELGRGECPITVGTRCLKFVLEGVERYEMRGRTTVVRAGEFIVVEAGAVGHVQLPQRQITRGLCVYLPDTDEQHGSSEFGDILHLSSADSALSRLLRTVAVRLATNPATGAQIVEQVVRSAALGLASLEAELGPRLTRIEAARSATRVHLLQKAELARAYLHDRPNRAVSLSELANATAMSPFHLARTFKAVHEVAPAEYHRALRLKLAASDFAKGDASLAELAGQYGFADASSLSRAFRRTLGASPTLLAAAREGAK